MIDKLWSGKSGWWRLLLPLSWLYGAITTLIRYSYHRGWRKSWRAPVPVVVVGNLTAGGNGKTPVVIWLVEELKRRGYHPAVVSRGYGGKSEHYPLLLNGETLPTQAGDEPVLIYQRTSVPVAVAPKRVAAVQAILKHAPETDIIITDDGLQHYALQRDIELVVIDGVRRFGNGWWLPAGPMRERAARLKSVDAVITNGGTAQGDEIAMHLATGMLTQLTTGQQRPLSSVNDVVAMAGIGHPPRFFNTLHSAGVKTTRQVAFADHQKFEPEMLASLTQGDQLLVMTEKDAVKCRAFAQDNWWYLPVDAQLTGHALPALLENIEKKIAAYQISSS